MTQGKGSDLAGADGRVLRANRFVRLIWMRALPGSVAVVAALTIPEFSVGAGDLGAGTHGDNRAERPSAAGQTGGKWQAGAAKTPLAGVRYAAPPIIAPVEPRAAAPIAIVPIAIVPMSERAIAPDAAVSLPSEPSEIAAALILPAPIAAAQPVSDAGSVDVALPGAEPLALIAIEPGLATLPAIDTLRAEVIAVAAADTLPAAATDRAMAPPLEQPILPPSMPASTAMSASAAATESGAGRALVAAPLAALPPLPRAVSPTIPAAAFSELRPAAAVPALAKPLLPATVVAAPAAASPGLSTSSAAPFVLAITARLVTRVDGKTAGAVDFQQTATGLKVRLGSIVDVLSDRYDPAQIARIQSSAASEVYLSLADLQAQGIPISYDPVYDEFNVGQTDTRPKSARKVHMDQISTPERGLGTTAIGQVPRR